MPEDLVVARPRARAPPQTRPGEPLTTIAAVLGHADVSATAIGAEARELVSRLWT